MIKWKLIAVLIAILSAGDSAAQLSAPDAGTPARLISGSISNEDYPPEAVAALAEGTSRILITVGSLGQIIDCDVIEGSGHAALDLTSCALARERFQFEPGRDAGGRAVTSRYSQSIRWRHPRASRAPISVSTAVYERGSVALFMLYSEGSLKCWKEVSGSAFANHSTLCPYPERATEEEILSATGLSIQVNSFTPSGQEPASFQTLRGELSYRVAAELEFRRDGRLSRCRDLDDQNVGISVLSVCDTIEPTFRIEPARQRSLRPARASTEIYRFVPERP